MCFGLNVLLCFILCYWMVYETRICVVFQMKNETCNMFKWVDDEIEEIDEVESNEAVQNDSNIAAFVVELMEETKKKKCQAFQEVKC